MWPSLRNKIQRRLQGNGDALSPGTVWGKLGTNVGKCFEGRGTRPLITGSELFEDLLRGNKVPEMRKLNRDWWKEREDIPPPQKQDVESFFKINEWMGNSSITMRTLFQFHWHYFFHWDWSRRIRKKSTINITESITTFPLKELCSCDLTRFCK